MLAFVFAVVNTAEYSNVHHTLVSHISNSFGHKLPFFLLRDRPLESDWGGGIPPKIHARQNSRKTLMQNEVIFYSEN